MLTVDVTLVYLSCLASASRYTGMTPQNIPQTGLCIWGLASRQGWQFGNVFPVLLLSRLRQAIGLKLQSCQCHNCGNAFICPKISFDTTLALLNQTQHRKYVSDALYLLALKGMVLFRIFFPWMLISGVWESVCN